MSPLAIVRTLLLSRQPPIRTTPLSTVPVLGAEMLTNGNMEIDANWSGYNAPTLIERSNVQAHGGTYSRHVNATNGSNKGMQPDSFLTTTVGQWIRATGWLWVVSGTVDFRADSNVYVQNISTTGSWQNALQVWRAVDVSHNCIATSNGAAEFYADDFSWQSLTLTSIIAPVMGVGTRLLTVSTPVTVTNGHNAGIFSCLDSYVNPLYYLHAYINPVNNRVYLLKVVNGTTTELVSGAITYVAGQSLKIQVVGPVAAAQVSILYNSTQIGATQTVDLSSGFGTRVAAFDTSGSATMEFTVVET